MSNEEIEKVFSCLRRIDLDEIDFELTFLLHFIDQFPELKFQYVMRFPFIDTFDSEKEKKEAAEAEEYVRSFNENQY